MPRINLVAPYEIPFRHERRVSLACNQDPVPLPDMDRRLVTCLRDLGADIHLVPRSIFLGQLQLPLADISIFILASDDLLDQSLSYKFRQFISRYPTSINVCLLPSATPVPGAELLLHFHDFFLWPCHVHELHARILRLTAARSPSEELDASLLESFAQLNLTGRSPVFLRSLGLIKKIAQYQATVLVQGETGTGKENAARAIHYLGGRSGQGFIPINCAAIPDDLLETELFGHEKGAFTDAKQAHPGLVAIANGGTLFLDEVDSLSFKAQAALLRFLQTQEYRPVGAKKIMQADVRIIAATNADLRALVDAKQFREDLFFRLNVLNLVMPPLRERVADIPVIANVLLAKFSVEYNVQAKQLSFHSLQHLMQQAWPGNIRELENTLLRSFLLSSGLFLQFDEELSSFCAETGAQKVGADDVLQQLPAKTHGRVLDELLSFQDAKALAVGEFEEGYLRQIMSLSRGNVTAAAKIAGKERRAFGKLLQKYAIDKRSFKSVIHC